MKPFKFRVWGKENKKWRKDDENNEQGQYFLTMDGELKQETCDGIINCCDCEISYSTGLFDRDDKEIFVGDILKNDNNEESNDFPCSTYEVIYDKAYAMFCLKDFYEDTDSFHLSEKEFTIIGNRFENPELLIP